jgi:hypothetical protein
MNKQVATEVEWQNKFNRLCFEVLYNDPKGKELLEHMELKYFRSPVAFPNMEPSWAYFNEGRNELLRSFTVAIQNYMNNPDKTAQHKQHRRKV